MAGGSSDDILAALNTNSGLATAAFLAILLVVATIVVLRGGIRRGRTILIVGPCNAGKTALWLQLREGKQCRGTVASMQPNEGAFDLLNPKQGGGGVRGMHLVDVPGHPRVRGAFERYLGGVRGIVFVVDALDFLPHTTETAEQLYEVLAARGLPRGLPVLLAANKADHGAKAHSPDFVRRRLERELDTLRATRAAQPAAGGGPGDGAALGRPGDPLTFASLAATRGPQVSVASISATAGDVQPVVEFIRQCLPS